MRSAEIKDLFDFKACRQQKSQILRYLLRRSFLISCRGCTAPSIAPTRITHAKLISHPATTSVG